MKRRGFNESAPDADVRDKSLRSNECLDIQMSKVAKRLKRAHDAHEEHQLKYDLEHEFDIGEDDE